MCRFKEHSDGCVHVRCAGQPGKACVVSLEVAGFRYSHVKVRRYRVTCSSDKAGAREQGKKDTRREGRREGGSEYATGRQREEGREGRSQGGKVGVAESNMGLRVVSYFNNLLGGIEAQV